MTISRVLRVGVAGLILTAGTVAAQDILLRKEGGSASRPGHFTRWSPPPLDDLPLDAKIHIIVKGDTLWDVAEAYLGDPYFWPQIWEVNRYIGDPHWIYPEDPLLIPQPMLITEVAPPDESAFEFDMLPPPQPVAKRYDVYCAPYIVWKGSDAAPKKKDRRSRMEQLNAELEPTYDDVESQVASSGAGGDFGTYASAVNEGESMTRTQRSKARRQAAADAASGPAIIAVEQKKIALSQGDVVYINRGDVQGVVAGDQFTIARPIRMVKHPVSGKQIGIAMQQLGRLKVICTHGEKSTAVIEESCDDINVGDSVKMFEPIPIPLAGEFEPAQRYCAADTDRPVAHIIYGKHQKISMATEDIVNIDMGSEAGIVPGDFLIVYRTHRLGPDFPTSVLGDAVVLMVEGKTATAKILTSYTDMSIGDQVRLR